jgi:hypothetical protein
MISVEKPPLSKKRSYVLRTSLLEAAVSAAGLDCHIDLKYWTPTVDGSILEAEYWLPNENVPYPRTYVRAGSLLREQRSAAAALLKTAVLPAFTQWLVKVLALADNSPILLRGPKFAARYQHGAVDIRHDFVQRAV